jgi:hypothetical protein
LSLDRLQGKLQADLLSIPLLAVTGAETADRLFYRCGADGVVSVLENPQRTVYQLRQSVVVLVRETGGQRLGLGGTLRLFGVKPVPFRAASQRVPPLHHAIRDAELSGSGMNIIIVRGHIETFVVRLDEIGAPPHAVCAVIGRAHLLLQRLGRDSGPLVFSGGGVGRLFALAKQVEEEEPLGWKTRALVKEAALFSGAAGLEFFTLRLVEAPQIAVCDAALCDAARGGGFTKLISTPFFSVRSLRSPI